MERIGDEDRGKSGVRVDECGDNRISRGERRQGRRSRDERGRDEVRHLASVRVGCRGNLDRDSVDWAVADRGSVGNARAVGRGRGADQVLPVPPVDTVVTPPAESGDARGDIDDLGQLDGQVDRFYRPTINKRAGLDARLLFHGYV